MCMCQRTPGSYHFQLEGPVFPCVKFNFFCLACARLSTSERPAEVKSKDEPKEAKAERPKPAVRSRKLAPEKPVEEMSIDEMIQAVDEPGPEPSKKTPREIEESSEEEPVRGLFKLVEMFGKFSEMASVLIRTRLLLRFCSYNFSLDSSYSQCVRII